MHGQYQLRTGGQGRKFAFSHFSTRVHGQTDGQTEGRTNRRTTTDGYMEGHKDKHMDGQKCTYGRMEKGWMERDSDLRLVF